MTTPLGTPPPTSSSMPSNGKINESDFTVPAYDKQGRSELYQFRGIPEIGRAIEERMYSRDFPFTTKGDMLRWCVYWGLKRLEQYKPRRGFMTITEIIVGELREQIYWTQLTRTAETLRETVDKHLATQSAAGVMQAKALVIAAMENARQIKGDNPWRSKLIKTIKKDFAHVLTMKVPPMEVDLDEMEDEEEGNENDADT